jgi:hypothetical protein
MLERNIRKGTQAEVDFIYRVKKIRPNADIIKATMEENISGHWDYSINGCTIDIKCVKNCRQQSNNYTIVEYMNDQGNKGWLYGDADYIAFQSGDTDASVFLLVNRMELVRYCKKNVVMQTVPTLQEARNKLFSRGNDLMTVVDMNYLLNLPKSHIIR